MPRSRFPWYKRYPGDWLNDVALQSCSLEARGAWAQIIEAMHMDDVSSKSFPIAGWQLILGAPSLKTTVAVLTELRDRDVAEVEGIEHVTWDTSHPCPTIVRVMSRRIEKEDKQRKHNRLRKRAQRVSHPCPTIVPGEKSEVRCQSTDKGRKTTRARGALGASDDALFSPDPTQSKTSSRKTDKKAGKRDPALIAAGRRFIASYPNRSEFQATDTTILKKFYALVEEGIHTADAIFWLLGEWKKSEEWRKGYICGPDKFLAKANQKYRQPPPESKRGGSLSNMNYDEDFDDV